jgi:hypothetical protein
MLLVSIIFTEKRTVPLVFTVVNKVTSSLIISLDMATPCQEIKILPQIQRSLSSFSCLVVLILILVLVFFSFSSCSYSHP